MHQRLTLIVFLTTSCLVSNQVLAECSGRIERRAPPIFPRSPMHLDREIYKNGACYVAVEINLDKKGKARVIRSTPSRKTCTPFQSQAERTILKYEFSASSEEKCSVVIEYQMVGNET